MTGLVLSAWPLVAAGLESCVVRCWVVVGAVQTTGFGVVSTTLGLAIFTDALSVLSKLQNPRQKDLNDVETALVDLAAQTNLILQWIPAHCGIQGNEQADRFAREGGHLEQEDRYTTYTDEKTIIKTLSKKKKMEAATPKLQPVRQPPQTEQDRAGYSVQVENWIQQT